MFNKAENILLPLTKMNKTKNINFHRKIYNPQIKQQLKHANT